MNQATHKPAFGILYIYLRLTTGLVKPLKLTIERPFQIHRMLRLVMLFRGSMGSSRQLSSTRPKMQLPNILTRCRGAALGGSYCAGARHIGNRTMVRYTGFLVEAAHGGCWRWFSGETPTSRRKRALPLTGKRLTSSPGGRRLKELCCSKRGGSTPSQGTTPGERGGGTRRFCPKTALPGRGQFLYWACPAG